MVFYQVIVYTSECEEATTFNDVFIKLVGQRHTSERTMLKSDKMTSAFAQGEVSRFIVSCPESLGDLVWIELDKQPHDMFPEDLWFPNKVEVKSEEERTYTFPIYCWITDSEVHSFCEGTGLIGGNVKTPVMKLSLNWFSGSDHDSLRENELKKRKKDYCWREYKEGLPHCLKTDSLRSLPSEVWFSFWTIFRTVEFFYTAAKGLIELKLTGQADCTDGWTSYKDIGRASTCKSTPLSDHVREVWRDDTFFGHQFLNGVNPMMIQRCTALPDNFPVTDNIVFLHGSSLAEEMKNGNIFLCDYKILDDLKPNTINGKVQYLVAPLVLLHRTPDDKLKPVAIQLKQTPGDDNPIFVPTDSEYDWLLAKTFVRSAEFNEHELNSHLLRTHLLAEVFSVSLLRNIPRMHPLYKLLFPHTRYTLQINTLARQNLISDTGVFTTFTSSGGEAMVTILKRSLSSLTYRSLCIKENIADRGLESVPNFYYREDGFRLWEIIYRFVQGILEYYYKSDEQVQIDHELQNWIGDIFEHGFLSLKSTGIPDHFNTVDEMVKFVTMVIFTCSAQHSAVNGGQYDYGSWMPNTPTSLQLPPPTKKGSANEDTLLQTLPDVNVTVHGMATMWLLSKESVEFIPLGFYREVYFSEEAPCKLISEFQSELQKLSAGIKLRNASLKIPYTYMDPALMENSVAL